MLFGLCVSTCLSATCGVNRVQVSDASDRDGSPLDVGFAKLGTLAPRSAGEVGPSNWTIGCEVLDRDFANFWEYCDFIESLGIRTVRLQAGWAKCEPKPGEWNFGWLDKIVDYLRAKGLDIILETSYGNPVYPGAGSWDLSGGIPTTEDGLKAWDNWIDVLSRHFADRVAYWAMWNEPDNNRKVNTPARVAAFNLRTAKIIRRNCPQAKLQGLSLGGNDPEYFEECLKELAKENAVDLFDTYIYHGYELAPEMSYPKVEVKRRILGRFSKKARLRQGENGCPSEMIDFFALWNNPWTEFTQAKWDLRRMLGDLGHGYESAVYTMSDFRHRGEKIRSPNNKGLVRANANRETIGLKRAYYAVQNTAGLFDGLTVLDSSNAATNTDITVAFYSYRKTTPDGRAYPLFTFWTQGHMEPQQEWTKVKPSGLVLDRPSDSFATRPMVIEYRGAPLEEPVWIDLLTGCVYEFPKNRMLTHSAGVTFVEVPVYDSPVVLTERAAVRLAGERPLAAGAETVSFRVRVTCTDEGERVKGERVKGERVRGERVKVDVRRYAPVENGRVLFRWPKDEIPRNATCVEVIPDFASARKGEDGYFVMPQGGGCYGRFRADEGRFAMTKNWFPITAFGMKTPRKTFVAMPTGMRWNFNPVVSVTNGVYTMSCRFDMDVATAYEDPAIEFRFLTGDDANYSGMGRAVRAKRLADGEMKPLRERAKTNPVLAWAVGTPVIRIRNCWKDFRAHGLPEQNVFDEPPVDVYCTFDRVKEVARAIRSVGVEKADLCLVGWNYRGHDGRYPQVFPVEPLLGGEAKLREAIDYVKNEIGWQITGHVNYRDAYLIADSFDFEYCQDRYPDGTRDDRHLEPWSGGAVYRICPRRAYEKFALKHTAMMKSLGFSGLGYLDVTTSRPLFPCRDERHPLDNAQRRVWENAILDLQTSHFGGCSSEGGYDFAIGHIDSGLTICYEDPFNEGRKKWNPLVDGRIPFWQIAYHGVVMSNPFRNTWNAAKNPDKRVLLKTVEYGARPVFYIYGGWNLPERACWDIKCRTDEELADCVKTIRAGVDEYNRRAVLEWEYMEDHCEIAKGVFRILYSNGASVYVNYNDSAVTVDGVTIGPLASVVRNAGGVACGTVK